MPVNHLSLSTTPVNLFKGNTLVSQGTGFYYVENQGEKQILFLVTNYHVVTGSAPTEKKAPLGDNVSFQFHESNEQTGKIKTVKYPLFTKTAKPVWLSNNAYPDADLAVIPVVPELWKNCSISCISADWAQPKMKIRPTTKTQRSAGTHTVTEDAANALPVWKTGSVASEPDVDFDGKPLFLIDVSAFPGMSGSPVFAIASGIYEMAEGGNMTPGVVRQFLGIYASMQMVGKDKYLEQIVHGAKLGIKDFESLEIGHVWKASLILDTVKAIDVHQYEQTIPRNLP